MDLKLLEALREAGGETVDLAPLRRRLGLTDAELARRVDELGAAGYVIRRTYPHGSAGLRLLEAPDRMYAHEVRRHLETRWVGSSIRYADRVGSTNDLARECIRAGSPSGTVVVAEEQTAGRGRLGRRWHSPRGPGLYFSLVFRPASPIRSLALLQITTGVAVAHGVMRAIGSRARLRWPNDVLVEGRKVAGLLVESLDLDNFVVGVGVNVNHAEDDLPLALAPEATSLALVAGRRLDRREVLATILASLEEWYDRMAGDDEQPVADAWRSLSTLLDREVVLIRGEERLSGTVVDLSPVAGVRLRDSAGHECWVPAEHVTYVRPAGMTDK